MGESFDERLYEQQCFRDACAGTMLRALRDLLEGSEEARRWFLSEPRDEEYGVTLNVICAHLNFCAPRVRRWVVTYLREGSSDELFRLLRMRGTTVKNHE